MNRLDGLEAVMVVIVGKLDLQLH